MTPEDDGQGQRARAARVLRPRDHSIGSPHRTLRPLAQGGTRTGSRLQCPSASHSIAPSPPAGRPSRDSAGLQTLPGTFSMWLAVVSLIFGFVTLVWSADRFLNGSRSNRQQSGHVEAADRSHDRVAPARLRPRCWLPLPPRATAGPASDRQCHRVEHHEHRSWSRVHVRARAAASLARCFAPSFLGSWQRPSQPSWCSSTSIWGGSRPVSARHARRPRLPAVAREPQLGCGALPGTRRTRGDPGAAEIARPLLALLGTRCPAASAEVLVWAATTIAQALGVSELIIGLTIIAIGTSLPELAATVGSH